MTRNLEAWIVLAETCTRQRYAEEALLALQKAAEINGNHPLFWRALCLSVCRRGISTQRTALWPPPLYHHPPEMLAEMRNGCGKAVWWTRAEISCGRLPAKTAGRTWSPDCGS
jgi:hypothetical protein